MRSKTILLFLLAALLISPVMATEQKVTWDEVFCFSQTDFSCEEAGGVLLTDVPSGDLGELYLGSRRILAGDVLTADQLAELTFVPSGHNEGDAVISCLQLTDADGLLEAEMTLKVGSGKNEAPVAEDSEFKTYKNIPGQVPLNVSDPENDPLTVTIIKEPKRGSLTVSEDGTVTYTPAENKVGHDSFVYTVTDPAGNTSGEATVRIQIEKPSDKQTYGDMEGHPAQLAAVWLREEGIYSGQTVTGQLLFQPEDTVTRGEFIAMCVAMTGMEQDAECLSTGFVDEADMPLWLSPYVSTALRCGYITGVPTDQGLALNADYPITQAEAAKIVSSLLALPETSEVALMEDGTADWASGAIAAMAEADLYRVSDAEAPLTRGEAAMLLHDAWQAADPDENTLLSWAKE